MLEALQTVIAFILTLGILVSIHEFGHFWVARRCGVKVLRFSIGFGKSIWKRTDKHGTEFSVALIPLGGYVKMLDEREGVVAPEQRHLSFNNKPVLSRIAIVAAGPLANFILAVAALWLMYMIGIRTAIPLIGEVLPESPAAIAGLQAGDEVLAVEGQETPGWQAVNMALLSPIGESRSLTVAVRPKEMADSNAVIERQVQVKNWLVNDERPDPVRSLGIVPYTPEIPAIVGEVVESEAAWQAGIRTGDKIIEVDDQPVTDWMHWVDLIRAHPGESLDVSVLRNGQLLSIRLTPGIKSIEGRDFGYIGAGVQPVSWPEDLIRLIQFGPVTALFKGAEATWSLTTMTMESLWKMLVGLVSVKNLSGPITIAKVAGASMQSGFENFLYFLGMLSVSLGVLNLLPIPVLDGGHLLFYLVELVRGRPLSEKVQMLGLKIGVTLVVCVMILAVYNDLSRLF